MGLRINTNVISLISQRNLGKTAKGLKTSLERLSSGYRINSARDDAAGLAISEGLTSQVRGLRQAIRNANDGIGFLATAEGALAEDTNIAQRIRELAIQAANGTLSAADRGYLNNEAQALIDEFERIAQQTDFNGVKLLDGSFETTNLQVGIQKGRSIAFSIGDARSSQLGAYAAASGAYFAINSALTGANLTINGYAIGAAAADGISYAAVAASADKYSAIAIAEAINALSATSGVDATVEQNTLTLDTSTAAFFAAGGDIGTDDLKINNVSVSGSDITTVAGIVSAVNAVKNQTGVLASVNTSDASAIDFVASDGRNIVFTFASGGSAAAEGDAKIGKVFNVTANGSAFGGMSAGVISGSGTYINVSRVTLTSADAFTTAGTNVSNLLGMTATTTNVNLATALNSVDISTVTGAGNALKVMDNAMKRLASLRSSLGAVSNRLDSTVSNLGTVLENVSAANSQIKDTDVAAETAELTRSQILQQAGISVLQQANVSAQVALALLRF